jgi:membrane-associated phospholipid phosphatase
MTTKPVLLPFSTYLILTTPLALISVVREGFTRVPLVMVHLALAMALVWLSFRSVRRVAPASIPEGDQMPGAGGWEWCSWIPLLVIPFLYWELPVLNQTIVQGYLDPWVQLIETQLFPSDPSASLAGRWPSRFLSEGLHLAYLSYYLLIAVPPLLWWFGGRRDLVRESVFRLTLTFTVCFLLFAVFPVEGPRYGGIPPAGIPEGMIRGWALAVLEWGSSRGTAFPSSHVAVALTQAIFLYKQGRWIGTAGFIVALGLSVGAVYGGFHYGVDVLVGAFVAGALAWMHDFRETGDPTEPDGITLSS